MGVEERIADFFFASFVSQKLVSPPCIMNPTDFCIQDSPSQSYYAVFDGHGGPEAAMFCASQLHVNLLRDPNFKTNPELALKQAYAATDKQFLHKAEEQVILMAF